MIGVRRSRACARRYWVVNAGSNGSTPIRSTVSRKISSGPGRLTEALAITRARDNGKSFVSPRSDLQIVDDGYRVGRVIVGPRIGITKSAGHPLRYLIAGNAFVSL